jgi:hypothetical protein
VTYWYSWLFNRTSGSVLLVVIAHSIEGSLRAQSWIYMGVWCAAAVGLIVCDRKAWHRPVDPRAVTSPEAQYQPAARR